MVGSKKNEKIFLENSGRKCEKMAKCTKECGRLN